MNSYLLLIVGIIYSFVGINYFINHNHGLGITFFAYAVSNYGLYLAGNT